MSREIENVSTALEGIVAGLAPSVVSVISHRMQTSGFVWRPGLIVTSDEGLAEEGVVHVILPGGESVAAQIVGRDATTATALVKVERSDLRPVALAAAIPLPGGLVVAIGAEAAAPTAAFGMVSVSTGPWQSMRGGEIDARVRARCPIAENSRGRACGECDRTSVRHDRVRTASPCIGDPLGDHRPGSGEVGDAWSDPAWLFGPRPATGDGRGRWPRYYGDERGPERPRSGGQHSSGRCPGELGRQARQQVATLVEILGARQGWKNDDNRAAARRPAAADEATDRRKASGLKEAPSRDRLRLAIDVSDAALAEKIASALTEIEGVDLVGADAGPEALIVAASDRVPREAEFALTARELEVLALLAEGASNKLIARRLGISAHTAKYHVASLLEKLDAVSRTDAVAHAARIGVLHL